MAAQESKINEVPYISNEMKIEVNDPPVPYISLPAFIYEGKSDAEIIAHMNMMDSLKDHASDEITKAKDHFANIHNDSLRSKLAAKDEPYGVVKCDLANGKYELEYTVGKDVSYDQTKLIASRKKIAEEWQENPDEYMTAEYSISETKYKAWPSLLKKEFEPARTVTPKKPSIKIKAKKAKE